MRLLLVCVGGGGGRCRRGCVHGCVCMVVCVLEREREKRRKESNGAAVVRLLTNIYSNS